MTRRGRLLRLALIALSAGGVAVALRGLDLRATLDVFGHLDLAYALAASAVMLAGKVGLKSIRSQILLRAAARGAGVPAPSPAATARLVLASFAAAQLAWGPLGYTVRTVGLRDEGLPLAAIARALVAEHVAEIASLAVLAVVALAIAPAALASSWLGVALLVALAAGVLAIVALVASRRLRTRVRALAGWGRAIAVAAVWALASNVADAGILALAAAAAHVTIPLVLALVGFLAVNGATAVPSTPAQLGVQETAIVVAFAVGGVPAPAALAVALAYRAAHVAPMLVAGLPALLVTWLTPRR